MNRFSITLGILVLVGVFTSWTETAHGQGLGRRRADQVTLNNPVVSPYLRLLSGNPNNTATQYQTAVRPLIEHREFQQRQANQNQQFQRQVSSLSSGLAASQQRRFGLTTGHRSFFQNYSHYYRFPR